jgi:hypothetical protein
MEDEYRYFKFRSVDKRLIESLTGGHLWFAKPGTLNDPFDCRLDFAQIVCAGRRLRGGAPSDPVACRAVPADIA